MKSIFVLPRSNKDPPRHSGAADPPRAAADRDTEGGEASHQATAAALPAGPVRTSQAAVI